VKAPRLYVQTAARCLFPNTFRRELSNSHRPVLNRKITGNVMADTSVLPAAALVRQVLKPR
jgi:hypothetical protein